MIMNGVYAVYRGSRHIAAKVQLFVDFLVETLGRP
jgi:DNA-binding transcriptional LysR family regulator